MDDVTIVRALHVLAVLLWIGGVAFVTLVVMPSIRAENLPEKRLEAFHRLEGRFAPQARIWVLLAGASGFWMVYRWQMWGRFTDPHFWWMHAMVAIWVIFAAMLFVIGPLFLHRRRTKSGNSAPTFVRMEWMHRALLVLSLFTVFGAVAGSHGLF
ncbi:hypothetical protein GCM10023219_19030 [Stakelama sediminis]|uniref:Copper resistance protein D domain-containing protein n=1 Tax=Stakelama sediminis TaxID=463200 RepID=A0A840Z2D7_9SPHN|nr:hypothetical protein [Stakelama sediminis]MBB5719914.1 hypothetical protein [Stakelama sediminis]